MHVLRLSHKGSHMNGVQSNSALLTDALGLQLRRAHRAAKRER
jgi:hypothetical protein